MADRILTWYVDTLAGDHTSAGPVFVLDRSYRPQVVRIHAKRAPDAGDLLADIKVNGVSIFAGRPAAARLVRGQTLAEVAEDWLPTAAGELARYGVVTLDLTPRGAAGITVHLELTAGDDPADETDT